jgi:hypothetical protein
MIIVGVLGVVILGTPAHAAEGSDVAKPNCRLEKSVYVAEVIDEGFSADELRFSFEPLEQQVRYHDDFVQQVVITSAKMGKTLRFGTSFTNGTAVESASLTVPASEFSDRMKEANKDLPTPMEELELSSEIRTVYADFQTGQLPVRDEPPPILVILPELRGYAHNSWNQLVSYGLSWGVFRFARCDS